MKIGTIGPREEYSSNYYYIGKILSKQFDLDLISYYGKDTRLTKTYKIKNYSKLSAKGELTYFIRDILNLYKYCRRQRPDILCSLQRPDVQGPLIGFFGKLFGIKTLVRLSGSGFENYKLKKGFKKILTYFVCHWFMRMILGSDRIICMNSKQKAELIRYGYDPKKIEIVLQPTDMQLYQPTKNKNQLRKKLGLNPKYKYIIYIGALEKYKGMDTFVNIIPQVIKHNKNIHFIFIGTDCESYNEKLMQVGGKNVHLLGQLPPAKTTYYLRASDLLLHPSLTDGFPRTISEAAHSNIPVIARDIVDLKKFASKTFQTDPELIKYILKEKWSSWKLPGRLDQSKLAKQYLKQFQTL